MSMNKYFKGKKTIYATKRAFEVIYKAQGFKEVKEKAKNENKQGQENKEDEKTADNQENTENSTNEE